MKITKKSILKLFSIFLVSCFLKCCFSCNPIKEKEYYKDKSNYIKATGTIDFINVVEDDAEMYLGFCDLNPKFDDTCFKIVGKNFEIVKNNGIVSKIEIGDEVEFITAPKYFGDGYIMPIVAISINGESLLDFEDGYENFQDWLEKPAWKR